MAVLLLAAVVRLFATMQKKSLNYKAGVRIAVVALTPVLIIAGLLAAVGQTIPALLYVIPALAYLYIAAGSARQVRPNELYLDDGRIGS
jgi:hypothetical protein